MAKEQPIVTEGIEYWSKQPADYNGVLGARAFPPPVTVQGPNHNWSIQVALATE